jgi:transposase
MMFCNQSKPLAWELNFNTNKSTDFKNFLILVLEEIKNNTYLEDKRKAGLLWIYMENASIHRNSEIKELTNSKSFNIIFGPTYTPEYNLVEICFRNLNNSFITYSSTTSKIRLYNILGSMQWRRSKNPCWI